MGQNRSDSLTGESKALPDNKTVPMTLLCRTVAAAGALSLDTVCVLTRVFQLSQQPGALIKDKLVYSIYTPIRCKL